MNRKLVGIMVSVMMLVTVLPITALATTRCSRLEPVHTGIFDRTTVRGLVVYLGMSPNGRITHLFALRLHYSSISLSGVRFNGVVNMRLIDIPTKIVGYHGHMYIFASFRGMLDI